jgi:phosphate:Na+ symporter
MVQTDMVRGLGGRLRNALRVMLGNRFRAFSGLAVTALLQSSTATALMLAGFLGSGFVTYESGLAATLGANVGTTLCQGPHLRSVGGHSSFDSGWRYRL